MWPVHTWLPDAHVEAPTAGSVILAAILLKMGGYGFLRFSLPMFPSASEMFAPLVFVMSVVAIIYTSLVALRQEDMKKLIAYSSVAHMGFVTIGIFTLTRQGIDGALFQMISHGLISAALFLCVGVVYDRMHSRLITPMAASFTACRHMPWCSWCSRSPMSVCPAPPASSASSSRFLPPSRSAPGWPCLQPAASSFQRLTRCGCTGA
jgi:NADH:ubiquinone oxidoreductase subunit 4 (subunit M)